MLPTNLLRFVNVHHMIIVVCDVQYARWLWIQAALLLVCASPSYGQPVMPGSVFRTPRGAAIQPSVTQATTIAPAPHSGGELVTFDAPAAVNGTQAYGINPEGEITGSYTDVNQYTHGFLRSPNGAFIAIDVPGAVNGTQAWAINSAGEVTGYYFDANFSAHGFIRTAAGSFVLFDVPGDLGGGTFSFAINDAGVVAGVYVDAGFNSHGFLRFRNGRITTFDPGFVQNLSGIVNPAGAVVGYFFESSPPPVHSFVRSHDGIVTQFEAPNVCQTRNGTFAVGINPAGVVVGTYVDAGCLHFHGFLRRADGAFTTIDLPGAQDTDPTAINPAGTVTGIFDALHGFLRTRDGSVTRFDIPGAVGLVPAAINPEGAVAGYWFDATGAVHGFLFQPQ